TLGIAGGAAWMVIVVQQVEGKLKTLYTDSPFLTDLIKNLGGANAEFNAAFLGAMFSLLPLLLMAFAVTQVNRWTADEDDGRLEIVLSAWFFVTFVGPELKLPEATLKLSAFYYYGTPLLHGLQLANVAVIVAVGAAALALGTLRFARKDIGV